MTLFKRKDKYIKIIKFKNDKSIDFKLIKSDKLPENLLLNNDHIFIHKGYKTFLTSDTVAESINPLDINSQYPAEKFKTAIESKIINDVFNTIKHDKLDVNKILLFVNIFISVVLLYFIAMR